MARWKLSTWIAAAAAAGAVSFGTPVFAEKNEVTLASQFGIGFMPLAIMEHRDLVKKHADKAGLTDVKVNWRRFNGSDTMVSGLISGSVDVISVGVPASIMLWEKTKGTPQEVRMLGPLGAVPMMLITRNPRIKSLKDFSREDRIAVPNLKTSMNAVALQFAAAELYGKDKKFHFDDLLVTMSQPDAANGMLSGVKGFETVFSTPPFQYRILEGKDMKVLLNTFEQMGPYTYANAVATMKFRNENPKLFAAVAAALREAQDIIEKDHKAAVREWMTATNSKLPYETVAKVLDERGTNWGPTPQGVEKIGKFMVDVGLVKTAPATWDAIYFPETVKGLKGN